MADELCMQPLPCLNMHEAGNRQVAQYCCFSAHLEPCPGLWGQPAQGCSSPGSCSARGCSKAAEKELLHGTNAAANPAPPTWAEEGVNTRASPSFVQPQLKNQDNIKLVLGAEANK